MASLTPQLDEQFFTVLFSRCFSAGDGPSWNKLISRNTTAKHRWLSLSSLNEVLVDLEISLVA